MIVGLLINGAPGKFMGWAFPVRVEDLEADQRLQDAVLSVHHAAFHTFSGPAVKIIENHLGRGFFKLEQIKAQGFQMQLPVMAPRRRSNRCTADVATSVAIFANRVDASTFWGPGGVKMAEKQRTEIDAGLLEELRARAHEQSRTERELLE
jgi:hypothetical protein